MRKFINSLSIMEMTVAVVLMLALLIGAVIIYGELNNEEPEFQLVATPRFRQYTEQEIEQTRTAAAPFIIQTQTAAVTTPSPQP